MPPMLTTTGQHPGALFCTLRRSRLGLWFALALCVAAALAPTVLRVAQAQGDVPTPFICSAFGLHGTPATGSDIAADPSADSSGQPVQSQGQHCPWCKLSASWFLLQSHPAWVLSVPLVARAYPLPLAYDLHYGPIPYALAQPRAPPLVS
jgi:hypothetical protein